MTPEQQRIAIAQVCGWTCCGQVAEGYTPHGRPPGHREITTRELLDGTAPEPWDLPDYLNDLNAMHEAERVLGSAECSRYRDWLVKNTDIFADCKGACIDWQLVHATAAQRAEAFLRTLNIWKP